MNGIKWRDDVQNYKKAIALCLLLLALAFGWFYLAGRGDVSDIRKRADETRSELESAREEQRDQAAALDRADGAIRDSAERADRVQEIERSDAAVIRESQSILAAVRGRGKKEN